MATQIIYPGTFDPITNGHLDLVERALCIFDKVIIAVSESSKKQPKFNCDERVALILEVLAKHKNKIEVHKFSGLLTDFARERGVKLILRGLRFFSDFEYEAQLATANRSLFPEIDTIFLPSTEKHTHISASLVREIAELGGDVSSFVPLEVVRALKLKHRIDV